MGDRELLEAAAKAASINLGGATYREDRGFHWPATADFWLPLADDGDALRLAVKLGIDVSQYDEDAKASAGFDWACMEPKKNDPYAATRRAIVRAAAALSSHQGKGE